MIIYHGSNIEVSSPNVNYSRKNLDFGPGFYTTSLIDQAVIWTSKFLKEDKKLLFLITA